MILIEGVCVEARMAVPLLPAGLFYLSSNGLRDEIFTHTCLLIASFALALLRIPLTLAFRESALKELVERTPRTPRRPEWALRWTGVACWTLTTLVSAYWTTVLLAPSRPVHGLRILCVGLATLSYISTTVLYPLMMVRMREAQIYATKWTLEDALAHPGILRTVVLPHAGCTLELAGQAQGTQTSRSCLFENETRESVWDTCAICLEDFLPGDVVAELHCSHAFHAACVTQWFYTKSQCPLRCKKQSQCFHPDGL